MIIAVTGHRPDKLGGYQDDTGHRSIRRHMKAWLEGAPDGPLTLISGGALGVDQFWMEVGLFLKLPVIAALPFEGYDNKWPLASRVKYGKLLDLCEEVVYVSEPGYSAAKLQTRNEWMVDKATSLVGYWNGSQGGTKNCIDYATSMGLTTSIYDTDEIIATHCLPTPCWLQR